MVVGLWRHGLAIMVEFDGLIRFSNLRIFWIVVDRDGFIKMLRLGDPRNGDPRCMGLDPAP